MRRIFSAIGGWFKKIFGSKRNESEGLETDESENIDICYPDYNVSALIDAICKDPDKLKKLPYDYLYGSRADYFTELFTVLENQYDQIQIDLLLGFISKEDYDIRMEDFANRFGFYKNQCLLELEVL